MRSTTRRASGILTSALGLAIVGNALVPGVALADQGADDNPMTVFLKAEQVGTDGADYQGGTDEAGECFGYDGTDVLWHFTSSPLTNSGGLTGTLDVTFGNGESDNDVAPSVTNDNVFHWVVSTSEPTTISSAVVTYSEAQLESAVDLRVSHTCAPGEIVIVQDPPPPVVDDPPPPVVEDPVETPVVVPVVVPVVEPAVEPTVEAAPVPAPEVQAAAAAAAPAPAPVPAAEVLGVQAAALPRTGAATTTLALAGGALIVFGGLSLYGSTLPAVQRLRRS